MKIKNFDIMTDNIKYSVIIPIYNAEKTLVRCVDSLLVSKRSDIQIILVNDGSCDGSDKIAWNYMHNNPMIDYLCQENAGVSRARNLGLDHAKGEYVTFVDSDDYVTADYFSVLDQGENCDLLVFAHESIGGPAPDESELFAALQEKETAVQRLTLLLASRKIMSPWNKRFKRDIINENAIRFAEGLNVGEDFDFCMAYAMRCRTVEITCKSIICVDISDQGSLSRKYRPNLDDKLVTVFHNVAKTVSNNTLYSAQTAQLLALVDYLYVKHVFSCISEEFKNRKLRYFRDRQQIAGICQKFRKPISDHCCGVVHFALRLALKLRLYAPFYLVSYLVKGRKYRA